MHWVQLQNKKIKKNLRKKIVFFVLSSFIPVVYLIQADQNTSKKSSNNYLQ